MCDRKLALLLLAQAAWCAGRPALQGQNAIRALKQSGSYDSLQDALRAARHNASPNPSGFLFENQENQLDVGFSPYGLTLTHPQGQFKLSLESYGYGSAMHPPAEASARARGNHIEYRRGALIEWYVNDERGLEQGFTIRQRPADPTSGPLTLQLAITGDLQPQLQPGEILFTRNGQPVIRYSGLHAWDATGRTLPSRIELLGHRVRLLIEDDNATYPVVVDPWLQQAVLPVGDPGIGDAAGGSVSLDGDTALVGANGKASAQGAAYVFVRSGAAWIQQQKLTASDGQASNYFGNSVSLRGDTAVVGAPGAANRGAAYVFVRSGATWIEQQKLSASDGQVNDNFGSSVSVSIDTVIAGSYGSTGSALYTGAAYVFVRNGAAWTQQQKLTASDPSALSSFGTSVSVSGDTAIIGAVNGAAYIFVRSGATWSQQQKLSSVLFSFGSSVSVDGDSALVGAPSSSALLGAACVFVRSGTTWNQQQILAPSDGLAGDNFGISASLNGDTLAVGAQGKGAAYVFIRSGATWSQQQKLTPSAPQANDKFGSAVSVSRDTVVVGAYGTSSSQGAAYAFLFNGSTWSQQQIVSAAGGLLADQFARAVSVDGNIAVVGAAQRASQRGSAYIFLRSGTTWTQQAELIASDAAAGDRFGTSVAISANTVVVANSVVAANRQAAYVFVWNGTSWSEQQRFSASDAAGFDNFGVSISLSGDTAVVGASYKDSFQGAAYVFVRTGTTWSQQQKLSASDAAASDLFGGSVSVSGDTTLIGAVQKNAAYIFVRSGTTWTQQQKLTAADVNVGYSVSVSGDTALVGAFAAAFIFVRSDALWSQQATLATSDGAFGNAVVSLSGDFALAGAVGRNSARGAVYVFQRIGTVWPQAQLLVASNGASNDQFGYAAAVSGDTAIIGTANSGAAYLFQLTHLLRTAASPATGGSVSPVSGSYFYPGTVIPLQATPSPGYTFSNWTGPVANPSGASTSVTMNAPVIATANFAQVVQVSVNTNILGASFTVDSITYTTPQTFNWFAGSQHQISVASPQPGPPGSLYVWLNWSDGQPASHTVTPIAPTTFTATFKIQYQLTMNAGASGIVFPPSGFFDAASTVNISATPNSGFTFANWTGAGPGSYSGPNASTSVTMNGPITENAAFTGATFTARLNAGGNVYNDPQANLWSPDPSIANTFTFLTQNPIRNTSKPYLYQSERFSLGTPFQYTFASVPNGSYNIRLLFAETYFTQPNQRKFNVTLNGNPALTNFDIVAAAGGSNTAIDTLHSLTVSNNQIIIQLSPVLSNPKISAIEITPQTTAITLAPSLSNPLSSGSTQQFTPTVIGNANTNVTYSLSPNIGSVTPAGLYTAAANANPTKVVLTATSQADPSKSATALIQLVPQPWASQDIGFPNLPGSSTFSANAFNLQGAGDLFATSDSFRFTFNKLTGDGAIVARVNQPFTGQTSNKSGVMMRDDLTPGSAYADTNLYSSIVGLFHWRTNPAAPTNAQFGAAGVPWVRLARTGNTISSYVSNDATAWIPIGSPQTLSAPGINAGLTASNGFSPTADTVTFDNIDLSTSPVSVSINEGLSSLAPNQQAQFTANVIGAANTAVTWSISPAGQGAIDPNTGLYTAPASLNPSPQTVTITATSVADPTRSASIIVYLGAFQVIRVNCGGPSHYDPTGTFWFGDTGAVAGQGNVYSAGNSIANTLTPYLYQSERFIPNATLTYKYFVPNGTYNVTLKFAEIYFTTTGNRVMNVAINGSTVLSNFDIVAQAGPNTATDRTFPVAVSNGAITIAVSPAVPGHAPKINAIQIQ